MAKIPEKVKQIAIVHAQLINSVVACCQNNELIHLLEPELKKAENNGWIELIKKIRKIISGNRNTKLLIGLDEEDAAIILSILVGLQNPNELPKLNQVEKADYAPESIAKLIIAYQKNDGEAIKVMDSMLKQMQTSDKDMQIVADIINKFCHKSMQIENLKNKLSDKALKLIDGIMESLENN